MRPDERVALSRFREAYKGLDHTIKGAGGINLLSETSSAPDKATVFNDHDIPLGEDHMLGAICRDLCRKIAAYQTWREHNHQSSFSFNTCYHNDVLTLFCQEMKEHLIALGSRTGTDDLDCLVDTVSERCVYITNVSTVVGIGSRTDSRNRGKLFHDLQKGYDLMWDTIVTTMRNRTLIDQLNIVSGKVTFTIDILMQVLTQVPLTEIPMRGADYIPLDYVINRNEALSEHWLTSSHGCLVTFALSIPSLRACVAPLAAEGVAETAASLAMDATAALLPVASAFPLLADADASVTRLLGRDHRHDLVRMASCLSLLSGLRQIFIRLKDLANSGGRLLLFGHCDKMLLHYAELSETTVKELFGIVNSITNALREGMNTLADTARGDPRRNKHYRKFTQKDKLLLSKGLEALSGTEKAVLDLKSSVLTFSKKDEIERTASLIDQLGNDAEILYSRGIELFPNISFPLPDVSNRWHATANHGSSGDFHRSRSLEPLRRQRLRLMSADASARPEERSTSSSSHKEQRLRSKTLSEASWDQVNGSASGNTPTDPNTPGGGSTYIVPLLCLEAQGGLPNKVAADTKVRFDVDPTPTLLRVFGISPLSSAGELHRFEFRHPSLDKVTFYSVDSHFAKAISPLDSAKIDLRVVAQKANVVQTCRFLTLSQVRLTLKAEPLTSGENTSTKERVMEKNDVEVCSYHVQSSLLRAFGVALKEDVALEFYSHEDKKHHPVNGQFFMLRPHGLIEFRECASQSKAMHSDGLVDYLELVNIGNFYALLGVTKDADTDVIERAYKSLMRRFHPDKHAQIPGVTSFDLHVLASAINKAKEVLMNEELRKQYDATLNKRARTSVVSRICGYLKRLWASLKSMAHRGERKRLATFMVALLAIGGGIAVTIATFGAASPFLVAALGSALMTGGIGASAYALQHRSDRFRWKRLAMATFVYTIFGGATGAAGAAVGLALNGTSLALNAAAGAAEGAMLGAGVGTAEAVTDSLDGNLRPWREHMLRIIGFTVAGGMFGLAIGAIPTGQSVTAAAANGGDAAYRTGDLALKLGVAGMAGQPQNVQSDAAAIKKAANEKRVQYHKDKANAAMERVRRMDLLPMQRQAALKAIAEELDKSLRELDSEDEDDAVSCAAVPMLTAVVEEETETEVESKA